MVQRKRQIHVGSVKKCMNKPIDALILKRVVINLQIDFPSQQEMRRSSLEGTKGVRLLWGTDILTADQKKSGGRTAEYWYWRTTARRPKNKERHLYLRSPWSTGHVSQTAVPGPASGSLGKVNANTQAPPQIYSVRNSEDGAWQSNKLSRDSGAHYPVRSPGG